MSNQPPENINGPNLNSHRPMLATNTNMESIKQQFVQQNNKAIQISPGGLVEANANGTVKEKQVEVAAPLPPISFYPFPDSGNIVAWMRHPLKADLILVVVNINPDANAEPQVSVLASCRQPEAAQMLCDGTNYLYKVHKQVEKAKDENKPEVDNSDITE